ncbi:uncharacterized protein RCO7_07592 [Rhynchosporium graminicola]|uniref:Uncharacterized protein n=1 Tax=Rhynchosporium graminicola TaxID=2792576 RepID=A0A1E1KZS2_9HELO|nr:uncharacterized protein RCO7_07592 [Rhynchosporium commune]
MPPHPVVVSGAIVVVAAAVAAAIAVYESPQARQFAEDVRRRLALALHSLGDEINPASQSQQPRFNRPEDAEGFLLAGGQVGENGVDADEESKKRQREELMYWNAVHLEKVEKERKMNGERPVNKSRGRSFDDFLQEDKTEGVEKGTYVYNTGADVRGDAEEGLRSRNVRVLNRGSFYANPFGDENLIDADEQRAVDSSLMAPEEEEKDGVSDLYSANEEPRDSRKTTTTIAEQLIDTSEEKVADPTISYPTMGDLTLDEASYTNHTTTRDNEAYASIHAWANAATSNAATSNNSDTDFYSPLPASPRSVSPMFSDPEISVPGSGEATPTISDSVSLAGSGEEVWAPISGSTSENGKDLDLVSLDGEGVSTPGTWTEVGSVVSEDDAVPQHA